MPTRPMWNGSSVRPCWVAMGISLFPLGCSPTGEAPATQSTETKPASESAPTPAPSPRDRAASAPSLAVDDGDDDGTSADASCYGPGCAGCFLTSGVSGGQPVWSRNPLTGECCRYDDLTVAPQFWPSFDTDAACQSDCRCSVLDHPNEIYGDRTEYSYRTERTSLDCRCSAESCPSTLAEAEKRLCQFGSAQRREGCGLIYLYNNTPPPSGTQTEGFDGDGWVFEQPLESSDAGQATPRLVGAYQFTPAATAPCQTLDWVAGREFMCSTPYVCQLCGAGVAEPCQ